MDRTMEAWGATMKYELSKITRMELRNYLATLGIALLLGTFFTAMDFGGTFTTNMVICVFTGSFEYLSVIIVFYTFRPQSPIKRIVMAFSSLGAGSTIGLMIGIVVSTSNIWEFLPPRFHKAVVIVILSTITGFLFWYIVNSQRMMNFAAAKIQKEKIKRLTIEKQVVEANLRLLQAQIEPHFLFNTLSNIITLLEVDKEKGQHMLEHLTSYLRMTLSQSRAETSTLGQEIKMIESYLNIFKIRMGDRLNFTIMIPEPLKSVPFPPMLLQPIVENSILHGLEPKVEGGDIWVKCDAKNGRLRLEIADSGLSFQNNKEWGVGLSNIKERLDALYDSQASLMFETNTWDGLAVIIEVPYDQN